MERYSTTDRQSIRRGGHGLNSLELTVLEIVKEEGEISIISRDGRDGLVEAIFDVDPGTKVAQESTIGSGNFSVRTIRNALRVPKKLGLIESAGVGAVKATYLLTNASTVLEAAYKAADLDRKLKEIGIKND